MLSALSFCFLSFSRYNDKTRNPKPETRNFFLNLHNPEKCGKIRTKNINNDENINLRR